MRHKKLPKISGAFALTLGVVGLLASVIAWLAPFTREEVLPLIGTAFGAALAVGSAVLVFEYQSRRDTEKIQQNFVRLLEVFQDSSQLMLDELAEGAIENLPLAYNLIENDHRRVTNFLDKFEFEDLRFTDAGWWLRKLNPAILKELMSNVERVSDIQESQRLAHELGHWVNFVERCKATISK